jgi:putative selenium metabolism protein SsnA
MSIKGYKNCLLLTMEEGFPVYSKGAILWNDQGIIIEAGAENEIKTPDEDVEYSDARGKLIMPGMVCGHGHLYSFLARGIALKDAPPENFQQILERLWWRLDKALDRDSVKYSALTGLIDGLRGGITTFIDHHASPNFVEGSLDIVADAARETGMRLCTCYEVSDRDGINVRDQGIAENLRFIENYKAGSHPSLSSAFGIHASFTVSDDTLEKISKALPEGSGIHIHCCEAEADCTESIKKFGDRPVRRLEKFNLLDGNSILAHGVHLNEEEMELIADRECRLIHNPMSNMNNAVGVAPILKFLDKGILTGLGTDGYSTSMFDEYAVASVLQKITAKDPRKAFSEPFDLLYKNNPAIGSTLFSQPVGTLAPGSAADFLLLDYTPPTPLDSSNLIGHMTFGISRVRPDEVHIGGKCIIKHGEFTSLDIKEIAAKSTVITRDLWEKF